MSIGFLSDPETAFAAQSQTSLIIRQCLKLIPVQHDRRIFPSIQLITVITAESVEHPYRRRADVQNKRSRKGARNKKHEKEWTLGFGKTGTAGVQPLVLGTRLFWEGKGDSRVICSSDTSFPA